MAEQDTNGAAATEQDSLLDALGSLREQRAAETTTDLPLPGFAGRLWATFRLPDAGKVTQLSTFMAAGARQLTGEAAEMLSDITVGLYLASVDAEPPIRREGGALAPGFEHLPGGLEEMPVNFKDARLERVRGGGLCPPRPHGREHSPATRVRALFNSDALMVQAAMLVTGWALGGGDTGGAIAGLSERFREGDSRE
jgi:hypothetical protein